MSEDEEVGFAKDTDEVRQEDRRGVFDANIVPFRRSSMLLTERDVLARIKPQDWLIQNIVERGYVYSLTGATSSGKTAIALHLGYLMGNPDILPLFDRLEVARGRTLYLAGENPTDVYRRMLAIRLHHKLKAETNIRLIEGVLSLKEHRDAVKTALEKDGPVDLIVVDTAAAFFAVFGQEENDNAAMGNFARLLREWTKMPGNPAVLVLCHPAKFVVTNDNDTMVPRGGSAFLAEIDGNITLVSKGDRVSEMHHSSKMRGPGFEPVSIDMLSFSHETFNDTRGRPSSTVIAVPITSAEEGTRSKQATDRRTAVLDAIKFGHEPMGWQELVEITGLSRNTVYRALDDLKRGGLVKEDPLSKGWQLSHGNAKSGKRQGKRGNGADKSDLSL